MADQAHSTPAPKIIASGGPVSRALAVMLGADPTLSRIRELRRAIADRIEADIALLDALTPDCDLEDGQREQFAGTRYAYQGAV